MPKIAKQPKKTVVNNASDEIKAIAENLLTQIEESSDTYSAFIQFVSMVEQKQVPVDIRHGKTGKTASMMAVKQSDEHWTKKLMGLKANAAETHEGISVFDMAVNDEPILAILQTATDLMEEDHEQSADSDLLDAYYETLVGSRSFLEDVIDSKLIVKFVRELHFNTLEKENSRVPAWARRHHSSRESALQCS